MSTLVVIGECMVEVAPAEAGLYRLGYAGDTFNAAWTSRLLLPPDHGVRYVTSIGTDWMSDALLAFMQEAGLDLAYVRRDPVRSVGLYAIRLNEGERSFAYWRSNSAATTLADDPAHLARALRGATMALCSGITLAILPPEGRRNLHDALVTARRAGTRIVFDPNHRPRLWQNDAAARDALSAFCRMSDIVLPSFSDEAALFGDASPMETADRLGRLGAGEIVVKNGPDAALCVTPAATNWVEACAVTRPVDTTGAGDAFNGAYLAARLQGAAPMEAAHQAHRVARLAVRTRGALVPRDLQVRLADPLEERCA